MTQLFGSRMMYVNVCIYRLRFIHETEKGSVKGVRFDSLYISESSCFTNSFLSSLSEKPFKQSLAMTRV